MNDFYRTLQKASYKECNCYVTNGVYTPPKNGKIEKYIVYITDWTSNYKTPSKDSINKLIAFANKEFEFDSVTIEERIYFTALVFSGLAVK